MPTFTLFIGYVLIFFQKVLENYIYSALGLITLMLCMLLSCRLEKYYFLWVASIFVWIILDTIFLVQDDKMITALPHFTCT